MFRIPPQPFPPLQPVAKHIQTRPSRLQWGPACQSGPSLKRYCNYSQRRVFKDVKSLTAIHPEDDCLKDRRSSA